jgi:hypothetical protein
MSLLMPLRARLASLIFVSCAVAASTVACPGPKSPGDAAGASDDTCTKNEECIWASAAPCNPCGSCGGSAQVMTAKALDAYMKTNCPERQNPPSPGPPPPAPNCSPCAGTAHTTEVPKAALCISGKCLAR